MSRAAFPETLRLPCCVVPVVCLVWLSLCQSLVAQAPPQGTEGAAEIATFTSPTLRWATELQRIEGLDETAAVKGATGKPALADFLARHGGEWEVRWDRSSDRPHLVQGSGIPLLPEMDLTVGAAEARPMTLQQVEALVLRFVAQESALLRVDASELVLDPLRSHWSGGGQGDGWFELQQTYWGIAVEGARVFVRLNGGRVIQLGTDRVADVAIDVEPAIAPQDALRSAVARLGLVSKRLLAEAEPQLKIFPVVMRRALGHGDNGEDGDDSKDGGAYGHRLVWQMTVRDAVDDRPLRLRLDAHDGEVLEVADLRVYGQATGKVHVPGAHLGITMPLPQLWVDHQGLQVTDAEGSFDYVGGAASAGLVGELIAVEDACGPTHLTTWDGNLDFAGVEGSDCAAPLDGGLGNTQAARDAYFYLTSAYGAIQQRFPMRPWPQPLVAKTNQPQLDCEASWDAARGSFSFARSDGECANSAEVPGILLHEVGHAADTVLGGAATDGASGEAQADVFAFLQTEDACIGRGLRPGVACLNCDPSCTGVRDLDIFASGSAAPIARPGTLTAPDGLSCDRFACPYPGGAAFQGPLGFQAHCESQIASAAVLDLYRELEKARGSTAGPLAFEELWYAGLPTLGEPYGLAQGGQLCQAADAAVDGCGATNWYSVLLAADDDDGNLANGTPNGCRIWQAFHAHGIACGEPPACFCKEGGDIADAGPDVTICRRQSVQLGIPGGDARTYQWQPGGQTTPQIFVSPDHSTEYSLTVTSSCGVTHDGVGVEVVSCAGFAEDFEAGSAGWTSSGAWHRVDASACASSSAAGGTAVLYYGDDSTCSVDTVGTRPRDLISPGIVVGEGMDSLRFDYFLASQPANRRMGRAELAVKVEGQTEWQPRWAVEVTQLTGDVWQTSPAISIAAHQGETLRLRFRFEAYPLQGEPNKYLGWMIDNVRITEGPTSDGTVAPTVSLVEAPTEPISECECVSCRFLAVDAEGRDLSEILTWSSDLDGTLAAGSRSALILSPGEHLLTGTVTDYGGLSASLSVQVQVIGDVSFCGLDRWPPAEPRLHCKDDEED